MDELRLRRLLDVARAIMAELDPDVVLDRLLELAQELTGARYAAIGVLDERREMLDQFLTKGIDEQTHRAIGDLPHGRGVLGVLIRDPKPLRLADVGAHPESYGFPMSHPPMRSFLGVPITVRGEVWGNLYLTEKAIGEFTQEDEDTAVVLADWSAVAINNARLYRDVRRRRDELQRANRGLETTTEITRALGGVTDLDRLLELVAKRSRALIEARVVELALLEGDELVFAAGAGEGVHELNGQRLPVDGSVAGIAFRSGRSQRLTELPEGSFARRTLGARTALVTPMIFHNRAIGILSAFDRVGGDGAFSEEDERLLQAFAASAATAVATAQTATNDALRRSMQASEQERRRWARELHDETLQELAGLKVLLSGARRSDEPARLETAVDQAVDMIATGIANLRALISDLRPAALDELGAGPAIEALVERVRAQTGLDIALELDLAYEQGRAEQPARAGARDDDLPARAGGPHQHRQARRGRQRDAADRRSRRRTRATCWSRSPMTASASTPSSRPTASAWSGCASGSRCVNGELAITSAPGEGTRLVARIPDPSRGAGRDRAAGARPAAR